MKTKQRCSWCLSSPKMIKYHDKEWGTPVHNDRKLFEYLVLDAFQAGLSWSTIINKRKNFRRAFDNFNYKLIARYDKRKINSLLKDAGIIRNRLKINATVDNAKSFIKVKQEFGTFDKYIWQFTGGRTIHNKWRTLKEIPVKTKESDAMSKDLKLRGFRFTGSKICYAFMQAAGLVNDHLISCYRYKELKNLIK